MKAADQRPAMILRTIPMVRQSSSTGRMPSLSPARFRRPRNRQNREDLQSRPPSRRDDNFRIGSLRGECLQRHPFRRRSQPREVVRTINLSVPIAGGVFGSRPNGVAVVGDSRAFVTLGQANKIAVVNLSGADPTTHQYPEHSHPAGLPDLGIPCVFSQVRQQFRTIASNQKRCASWTFVYPTLGGEANTPMSIEGQRLRQGVDTRSAWRRWGPYLSERQWGTVREDYSPDGTAWGYFPHDHARSRAYRWGDDGNPGIYSSLLLLLLFVFGPTKLPELGKGLAQGIRSLKAALSLQSNQLHGKRVKRRMAKLIPRTHENQIYILAGILSDLRR
jgi:hypothetical protein